MARSKSQRTAGTLSDTKTREASAVGALQVGKLNEEVFSDLPNKIRAQLQNTHTRHRDKACGRGGAVRGSRNPQVEAGAEPRGKKRARNGKPFNKHEVPKVSFLSGNGLTSPTLEAEVHALGGTVEDLDLIAQVQSDSEVEDAGTSLTTKKYDELDHKSIQRGLHHILNEIASLPRSEKAVSAVIEKDPSTEISEDEALVEEKITEQQLNLPKSDGKSRLLFEPRPDWFNAPPPVSDTPKPPPYTLPRQSLNQLFDYANSLLSTENEVYKSHQQLSSARSFYSTIISSGTLSDKISALTLAVQESPVHNVKALESLAALAKKRSRAQAVDVLRALKDLFAQGSLLPSDRKLFRFASQPDLVAGFGKAHIWRIGDGLPKSVQAQHLISWAFEHRLKEVYFEVLKILELWCNDEIEYSRSRAVSYVYELLREKPEQESNLLRLLINKLGDPVKKIASQTSYLLMQLMAVHPLMKSTIISAVEADILFRPGQSLHAKYYAIITLNQTVLSAKEDAVAAKLLNLYFSLFIGLLKPTEQPEARSPATGVSLEGHKGRRRKQTLTKQSHGTGPAQQEELHEKLTSAILTGIHRAYPYVDSKEQNMSEHLNTLFKITHSSNSNTSVQAMILIQQLTNVFQASSDRFYRTLYESLLDIRLVTSSKQSLYLNLLYRSLKADVNIKRVKAFAKRLVQSLTLHQPPFICGSFFLLKELEVSFPSLKSLMDRAEDHGAVEESFRDVEEDGMVSDIGQPKEITSAQVNDTTYDSRKRDPEHSHAEYSCFWEVMPFLAHYHPTISVSAANLVRHEKLPGKPDLNLHTLIHFLDRFVYRNPKSSSSHLRGSSIMQPMAANDTTGYLVSASVAGRQEMPVNAESFRKQTDGNVAAEDIFFHKYFANLGKESLKTKKKVKNTASETASTGGEGEDDIWKAMMDSAPELEGAESGEEDVDMADWESESDFEQSLDAISVNGDGESEEDDNDFTDRESVLFDESADEILGGDEEEIFGEATASATPATAKTSHPIAGHEKRRQRKRMKGLPTFAAASDYRNMLEDEDGEDLGP